MQTEEYPTEKGPLPLLQSKQNQEEMSEARFETRVCYVIVDLYNNGKTNKNS